MEKLVSIIVKLLTPIDNAPSSLYIDLHDFLSTSFKWMNLDLCSTIRLINSVTNQILMKWFDMHYSHQDPTLLLLKKILKKNVKNQTIIHTFKPSNNSHPFWLFNSISAAWRRWPQLPRHSANMVSILFLFFFIYIFNNRVG